MLFLNLGSLLAVRSVLFLCHLLALLALQTHFHNCNLCPCFPQIKAGVFVNIFFLCILKGRESKRAIRKEIFHPLAHSPNVYNHQGWERPKPAPWNLTRSLLWVTASPAASPAFQEHKPEWGVKPGLKPRHSIMGNECLKCHLNPSAKCQVLWG